MTGSIECREFGHLPGGERVDAWTLSGPGGLTVEALTFGGIVRSILTPDRHGDLADVVLGFQTLGEYVAGHPYFGAIVGRVAGRITGSCFDHEGASFRLSNNDGANHLHGGFVGFDRKLWIAQRVQHPDGMPSVRMSAVSADGEEGYPGNVQVSVTYTVLADNTLSIETEAVADRSTPVSLTHHSYFNLGGEGGSSALDHIIQIEADEYVPTDERMTLTGRLQSVAGGSEDLRQPVYLGGALVRLAARHGALYKLRSSGSGTPASMLVTAARLAHPGSGRVLEVATTEPYLQFYTGASLDGALHGKSGVRYGPHQGVCFECEGYPDGANTPQLGNIMLVAGKVQHSRTTYRFALQSSVDVAGGPDMKETVLSYDLPTPARKDVRLGILGSGFIVDQCHLVSYRKAGFNPVAIASRSRENALKVASRHGIERVHDDYEALLSDPSIEVLDIAVPPPQQLPLIRSACERGTVKGILAQKPLALNYEDALEAVRCCEAAGIELAVNQNMRYDPTIRAMKQLLLRGELGTPIFTTLDMRGVPHWQPWQAETGSATLRIMSVHHLDCMRFWFGDPTGVICSTRTDPRTTFEHTDGICTSILEYAGGLRCVIIDDVWAGPVREGCPGDLRIEWRVEGLQGQAIGDIGWCKDPYTSPSTMRYAKKGDAEFHHYQPVESWFPDAFAGTMGELLVGLERGVTPANGGRDNLRTMALVEAAALSAKSHRMILLDEIESGRVS